MKIYFLYTGMMPFVRKDLEILQSIHEVRAESNYRRAIRNILRNFRGILWSDLVFCWFSSIHFFPAVIMTKLFGKKLIIVTGGYDVANLPDIAYGNMRGGLKTTLVRFILGLADRVIPVSESSRREAVENAKVYSSRVVMIYLGFHPVPEPTLQKEQMVVTAGEVTWVNLKRKGLEDFVRIARYFPEVPFKLMGRWTDNSYKYLQKLAGANVEIMGFVNDTTYTEIISRAKVYVQPSRHEGFGCAVAEAMLHECIPVVNNVFSLPEVVGDCGFLVLPGDTEDLRKQISNALNADAITGDRARERIIENFSLSKRAEALLNVVANV